MHRIISVLLLVPCLAAGPNSATADWAVVESLAVGERIQVELSIGESVNGKIDHVTPEAVFVQHGSQTTEIRRHEVNRLYRQKSGAGAKWAAIGALIGAGAGVGGGAATISALPVWLVAKTAVARVPGVENEFVDWPQLDILGQGLREHTSSSEYLMEESFGGCALRWPVDSSLSSQSYAKCRRLYTPTRRRWTHVQWMRYQ
jgi:hypothetical protein